MADLLGYGRFSAPFTRLKPYTARFASDRYRCEVRVRSEPVPTCRRANKKRKDEETSPKEVKKLLPPVSSILQRSRKEDQLQSNDVSSTVLDSPTQRYERYSYGNYQPYQNGSWSPKVLDYPVLNAEPNTAFRNVTYPINQYNYHSYYYAQNPLYYQPHQYAVPKMYYGYNNWSNYNETANLPNFYETQTYSVLPDVPNFKPLGEITNYTDNLDSFKDSQIGGVAIALGHGSVLFECAKHELHATTALKKPDRSSPTRISLVFYQHRNLNKSRHGWDEYDEKMRIRKLGNTVGTELVMDHPPVRIVQRRDVKLRAPTLTTMTVTTLFPMYPCIVTGPYQEKSGVIK